MILSIRGNRRRFFGADGLWHETFTLVVDGSRGHKKEVEDVITSEVPDPAPDFRRIRRCREDSLFENRVSVEVEDEEVPPS
jgi:hypothetical protein